MLDLAFAMAPPPESAGQGEGSLFSLFPPVIMMFLIFFFILVPPQQKKKEESRKKLHGLKGGGNGVTLSGIHGQIKKLKEDIVVLQIDNNVRIKINRTSIGVTKKDLVKN